MRRWLPPVIGLAILLVAPAVLEPFRLGLLGKFLAFAIVALGLDLVWGYTGMLSLGHGVFFGMGAYAAAMYLKLEASGGALPDFMGWSGLREMPGRKSVVLLSDTMTIFNGKGEENYRTVQSMRRLTDLANRASVVIYTIDPRGVVPITLTAADIPNYLRATLTPRSSVFSTLRTRFGQVIRLREHFRDRDLFERRQTSGFNKERLDQLRKDLETFAAERYQSLYHRWKQDRDICGASGRSPALMLTNVSASRKCWLMN